MPREQFLKGTLFTPFFSGGWGNFSLPHDNSSETPIELRTFPHLAFSSPPQWSAVRPAPTAACAWPTAAAPARTASAGPAASTAPAPSGVRTAVSARRARAKASTGAPAPRASTAAGATRGKQWHFFERYNLKRRPTSKLQKILNSTRMCHPLFCSDFYFLIVPPIVAELKKITA